MKYIIFTLFVLVVVGFVYKDELNQYFEEKHIFQFKDKDSDQNTANNNKYKSLIGDDKLVQAIINSDGEAVEAILSSTENGEFIRMLKSLKPEKIYSIMDVARSTCKPGPACSKKVPPDDDVIQNCAETMMSIKDNEIKKRPHVKKISMNSMQPSSYANFIKTKQSVSLMIRKNHLKIGEIVSSHAGRIQSIA